MLLSTYVRVLFCFFTGKAFQSNQIDSLEKILFLEEFQQIHAERITEKKEKGVDIPCFLI